MASLNRVTLIGNLGKDPISRYMPNGEAVCNFSVATTDTWKDKTTGEKKDSTEWHAITAFGKLAEICTQYLKKGASVYIEGAIRTRKWQDKEGQDRYTTEIKADEMKMLSGRQDSSGERQEPSAPAPQRRPAAQPSAPFDDFADDIPFN